MTETHRLPIYEEILLLALDDDKGTTALGSMFCTGMGGAILAELVILGAIKISDDKHKRVTATGKTEPSDAMLAECLAQIKAAKKPKKANEWVQKFANIKHLKENVAGQLVAKGILKEEKGTTLRIFKWTHFPESDPRAERHIVDRLQRAIFTATSEIEDRTLVLVALAKATGLLENVFDKKRLKDRKDRLEKLCSGQLVGKATKEAVEAVQTAIMVTTMIPIITATTITST